MTLGRATMHDVLLPSFISMKRVGVRREQIAVMRRGVGERGRVLAGTEVLAELVAGGVLADLVNREAVAAAVDLECDFATLAGSSLLQA